MTTSMMKCISIRQPWAWLIVRPDLQGEGRAAAVASGVLKDIENRTWATRYRGRVLIHAAQGMTRLEYLQVEAYLSSPGLQELGIQLPSRESLMRGGIVGIATLADCLHPARRQSAWHMQDQNGFQLTDAQPLPFSPLRGSLGLFNVPWSEETP